MKKVIFTLFLSFLFLCQSMAQITLDQSDVAPPLTKFQRYNDTLPLASILPGSAGPNQTWNFSALHHHTTDTMVFTNTQWTIHGSSFTNSNLCMMTLANSIFYSYLKNTPDSLSTVGQVGLFMGSTVPIIVHYNPTQKLLNFPTNYMSSFNTSSKFQVVQYYGQLVGSIMIDSIRVRNRITVTNNVDAWGSLTIPIGIYNCLRAAITTIEIDSVWAKNNTMGTWIDLTSSYGVHDTTKKYTWWAKDIGFTLAEIFVVPSTDVVLNANYLGAVPVPGGINELATNDNSDIYPNPANDVIFVSSAQSIKSISVFNTPGALVKSEYLNNFSGEINISELSKGIYIVRMYNNNNEIICVRKLLIN
jgi:hypothetical protein